MMLLYFYNYISLDLSLHFDNRLFLQNNVFSVMLPSNIFLCVLDFINTRLETQLCLETKLRTFLCFCRVPQSKFETNRSRGSWVIIRHQTDKERMFLYTLLAWEPSFAWNQIFPYNSEPTQLRFLKEQF